MDCIVHGVAKSQTPQQLSLSLLVVDLYSILWMYQNLCNSSSIVDHLISNFFFIQFSSVQSLSRVRLFETP